MKEYLILENFATFLEENTELFEEAVSASAILTDEITYESYTSKLLEGLEENETKHLQGMFDRQRSFLLEESSSLMSSPEAISYAVASFPMLVDIYSDPLLSKVVSVYPSSVPTMSIPRLKWVSKIIDHKGNVTEVEFPTATQMVRPGFTEPIMVGQTSNVFKELTIEDEKSKFRLNKRNFKVIQLVVNDGTSDIEADVLAVADARGNFAQDTVTIVDGAGAVVSTFRLQGQINFESGDVSWSIINLSGTPMTAVKAKLKLRLMGIGNGKSVIKARPKQDMLDINCDIEDSFEIENIEEVIQDWKSLYNLDIIDQLKSFVKDQIKLNRDFEIAELLETNIPYLKTIGHYREIDLSTVASATATKPANVQDIFKNIIPVLIALIEKIRKTTRMEVRYIVTGIDSAAVLKSLQAFAVKFDKYEGSTGFSGTVGDIAKIEIVSSHAVGDEYIHLVPKSESLALSTIVEISHKPLYIITETTDSVKRSFIKSRNWIGIVRGDALGCIKLKGYEAALGLV